MDKTSKQKSSVADEAGRKRGRPPLKEEEPVSLAPLSFQEALAGILEVPPDRTKEQSEKRKPATKKRASKKR